MPKPVEWLGNFQVNTGVAATGTQSDPHIIGLSNGNILVAWTEGADGIVGSGEGADIVGQMYDALGEAVGSPFQINTLRTAGDQSDFDIVATQIGAFAVAYVHTAATQPDVSEIIYETFRYDGSVLFSAALHSEADASGFLKNPQIAMDYGSNTATVSFTDHFGGNGDINAVTIANNVPLSGNFAAASNSAGFEGHGDIAVLEEGEIVSVYRRDIGGQTIAEARIMESDGALIQTIQLSLNAVKGEVQVAAIIRGDFVAVWQTETGKIKFAVYDAEGSMVTAPVAIESDGAKYRAPEVVALRDGGFVIIWDDATNGGLMGQRFFVDGSTGGGAFVIEGASTADANVGLTGDGRLLFTWIDGDGTGEVHSAIWDSRKESLSETAPSEIFIKPDVVVASRTGSSIDGTRNPYAGADLIGLEGDDSLFAGTGSSAFAGSGDDRISVSYGFADELYGEQGNDTIGAGWNGRAELMSGGGGNDSISGGTSHDRLDGGSGSDTIHGGEGNDTIIGATGSKASNKGDSLSGGDGNDSISGTQFDDSLSGGEGSDYLDGGLGSDWARYGSRVLIDLEDQASNSGDAAGDILVSIENLQGGTAADTLFGNDDDNALSGGSDNDSLFGRGGDDTLDGGTGRNTLIGGGGADEFHLIEIGDGVPDLIKDFAPNVDTIVLDRQNGGLPAGAVSADAFALGNKAREADDRLIYKAEFGKLYFDRDGTGPIEQVLIATFENTPTLDAGDFIVI